MIRLGPDPSAAVPGGGGNAAAPSRHHAALPGAALAGAIAVLPGVMTLALLAYAALGPAGAVLGARAAFVSAGIGAAVYALLATRSALPAGGPSSATALALAALAAELALAPGFDATRPADLLRLLSLCGLAVAGCGLLQLAVAVLGGAHLLRMVPQPVLAGFMNGAALLILLAQLPLLLGLPLGTSAAAATAGPGTLAALGLAALAVAAAFWIGGRWPRLPAAALALLLGVGAALLLRQLAPQWASWPMLSLQAGPAQWLPPLLGGQRADALPWGPHAGAVLRTALVLAVIATLEQALNVLALDQQSRSHTDTGRDLAAAGTANLASGLLGGLPVVLLQSRALPTLRAGGGRGALVAGALLLALVYAAGSPLLAWVPVPVLGGLMCVTAFGLADRWTGRLLRRWWRRPGATAPLLSLAVVLGVMVLTLWHGLAMGVAVGVLLSLLLFVARMRRTLLRSRYDGAMRPSRRMRPAAQQQRLRTLATRIVGIELQGALFFATGDDLLRAVDERPPGTRFVLLDLRRVQAVDESGAAALERCASVLAASGAKLLLCGIAPGSPIARQLDEQGVELPRHVDADRGMEQAEDALLRELSLDPQAEVPLAACQLFAGLDAAELAEVATRLQRIDLAAGQRLFARGDAVDGVYVLTRGSVTIRHPDKAHDLRLVSISPGAMLGEAALFERVPRSAEAVADEAASLYRLPLQAWDHWSTTHPGLLLKLVRNMAAHLAERLRAASLAWQSLSD